MLQSDIIRNDRGVDVCHRVVKRSVPKVTGDNTKGFHAVETYCNQPVTLSISEGRKVCPSCDKQPPVGWVNPRITNAAGIILTQKELEQCGVTTDTSLEKPKAQKKIKETKKAVEAKVTKTDKDTIKYFIDINILEQSEDIPRFLIKSMIEGLDKLPVTNFAESKRLIRLQEKLEALLAV